MKCPKPVLLAAATAICLATATPAFAQFFHGGDNNRGVGPRGAPGPVAGVGLPFLIAAGAYWLVRRRNKIAHPPGSVDQA